MIEKNNEINDSVPVNLLKMCIIDRMPRDRLLLCTHLNGRRENKGGKLIKPHAISNIIKLWVVHMYNSTKTANGQKRACCYDVNLLVYLYRTDAKQKVTDNTDKK